LFGDLGHKSNRLLSLGESRLTQNRNEIANNYENELPFIDEIHINSIEAGTGSHMQIYLNP